MDTEAIVATEIHPADRGDTTTLAGTLAAAAQGLNAAGCGPTIECPTELVADKGYHSRAVLKDLADGPWQTRIAEPKPKDVQRWRGDLDARRAGVWQPPPIALRRRQGSLPAARRAGRAQLRAQPRSPRPASSLATGPGEPSRRYLVHVAGYNLGLVMRALLGAGTPEELAARRAPLLWLFDPALGLLVILLLAPQPDPDPTSSTRC